MNQKEYQFVQIPTKLILALDSNCEKVLIAILTLKGKNEDEKITTNGELLSTRTGLSTKVVYNAINGLAESNVITVSTTKYYDQEERNFKSKASVITINEDKFKEYDNYSFEEVMLRDDLKIKTKKYFKTKKVKEEDPWVELYEKKSEPKVEYRSVEPTVEPIVEPIEDPIAEPEQIFTEESNHNSYESLTNSELYDEMIVQMNKTGEVPHSIDNELIRRDKQYVANPDLDNDNFYNIFGFLINTIRKEYEFV